jgi:hypothetical protein
VSEAKVNVFTLPLKEVFPKTDIAAVDGDEVKSELLLRLHVEDLKARHCITLLAGHC